VNADLLSNPIVVAALVAAGGLVGAYAGARLLPWLVKEKQGYPGEAEIEAALFPHLVGGLVGAYKLSERKMDELGQRLEGIDKKALADAAYALLPDTIMVGDVAVPVNVVKYVVTRERWRELVQDAFDRLIRTYNQNRAVFDEWFQEQIEEMEQVRAS
jgi:hypothetical protein